MQTNQKPEDLYIGCISGTSLDGLDLAVVHFQEDAYPTLRAANTVEFPQELHFALLSLTASGEDEIFRMGQADYALGLFIGEQILRLLTTEGVKPDSVRAIGSHGQTVRHHPELREPFTLQIGSPSVIAETTGIMTIADFRSRDIAAGGQGAPLASAYHRYLFANPNSDRAVINIGGMSNVTLLSASDDKTTGFDTGPGNILMDAWCRKALDSEIDTNGRLSALGRPIPELLAACLKDEYFSRPPPKSTGREYFNLSWLEGHLSGLRQFRPEDVLATLVQLTATTLAQAIQSDNFNPELVWVCGGGRHNATLLSRLAELCPETSIQTIEDAGMDGDFIEAATFAWLAREYLFARPSNIPEVTGASGRRPLGALYLP